MTKGDGLPCKRCGKCEWREDATCIECNRINSRRWNRNNKERKKEVAQAWYRANTETVKRNTLRWQRDNPDRKRAYGKNWEQGNPEKANAKTHRRRTRKTKAGGSYTAAEFKQLCNLYDNRCLACGKKKKLTADHVIPVFKGGTSDISNIQPLCLSCNDSKGIKTTDYRTKPGIKRWIQDNLFG